MPLTLTVLAGQPPLPVTIVPDSGELTIGRGSDCGLILSDPGQRVSLRHCRIVGQGGTFTLVDSSTNGTSVNDRTIAAPHRLAEGDVIGIGDYRLRAGLAAARGGGMNLDSWGARAASARQHRRRRPLRRRRQPPPPRRAVPPADRGASCSTPPGCRGRRWHFPIST